ncbi:TPA: SemiSWEET transporter [Vibrio cholerae]|uniref:SemiSWEET transporter n=1 Tax=Vibrio paracholerae TaxID=650003 RepID=UPI00338E6F12
MEYYSIIGYLAACLTTLSFLPQAVVVIRTRDTRSISITMYIMFVLGVFLWFVYGVIINNSVVVCANVITFVFAFPILVIKYLEQRKCKRMK